MARRRRLWSVTVGGYGYTVTVCERRPGGPLYLRWWDSARGPAGNWTWRGLRHPDRERGEAQARELAGELLAAITAARTGRLSVAELFARYEREVSAEKKGAQPSDDRRRVELWQQVLGSRDVKAIDVPTLDRFVRDRRAGRIVLFDARGRPRRFAGHPTDTTIGADIVFLNSVLNWATKVRLPDGTPLLAENPIRGYERPINKNPRRPVASYDRFLTVREQADAADPQRLFGAFLDLIEALGWRVSAVCQLSASDFDRRPGEAAPFGRLRKRGDVDKEGVEMWVPLSAPARAALDRALDINPVIGEMPIFPMPNGKHARRAWTRYHARELLERAEAAAGLSPLEGGDFHPYRRAWATARKHLPAQDVAHAGGWRDLRSLQKAYQQVDAHTLLTVVMDTTKVREVSAQKA